MSNQPVTDYEKLYHIMNKRRGLEHQTLGEACGLLTALYASLIERDKLFQGDSISWERAALNDAMVKLNNLLDIFIETDRMVEASAIMGPDPQLQVVTGGKGPIDTQDSIDYVSGFAFAREDILREIDRQVEGFLLKLDNRFFLKRFNAAKTAIKLLMIERSAIPGTVALYKKIAEQIGGTKDSAERNLRSFRESEKVRNSDFYIENLSDYNSDNSTFYWKAVQIIETELSDGTIEYLWKKK